MIYNDRLAKTYTNEQYRTMIKNGYSDVIDQKLSRFMDNTSINIDSYMQMEALDNYIGI